MKATLSTGGLKRLVIGPPPDFKLFRLGSPSVPISNIIVPECIKANPTLLSLLDQITRVDYRKEAGIDDEKSILANKHYLVITITVLLDLAKKNNWGLCRNHGGVYLFNGAYWLPIDPGILQIFLGLAAEKMGINKIDAHFFTFREQLFKQYLSTANNPKIEARLGIVCINLLNGTFEISSGVQALRPFNREDFITYQLPFAYDPNASAPLFEAFLNKVQPDKERQLILAEYLGYLFISTETLKLEKALLLYGSGANGKSVFFEVVNALLGRENVSNYSLQSLTDEKGGHYRARIADMLLNYATEISGKLDASVFKAMVSGEPIEARPLYQQPFLITNYAKLIFNCNELPRDVEQTNAFFRRFLIIPFDVTIPEVDQDPQLSQKIIRAELSGVFNWVLEGLKRLLTQKKFTESSVVAQQLQTYREQADSVFMFLQESSYVVSVDRHLPRLAMYKEYTAYCHDYNYRPVGNRIFGERLSKAGFQTERRNYGNIVYAEKKFLLTPSLPALPTPPEDEFNLGGVAGETGEAEK